jgi:F420-dependent oxidoreductase-like protein
LRLGLTLGYWGLFSDGYNLELALEAERLGFSSVWVAEAYGSDAATVLSWLAAKTTSIDLGSAIMQIPARTPAMTAMTAATLDTLTSHRFRLGLGVSGPQVSEGWHGQRFDKPLARTREYIAIVRKALSRERVTFDGAHYQLPLPGGPGKALQLTVHGARADLPIYIAALGPKNLELTGEIADGWLGVFTSPESLPAQLESLAAGRAKSGKSMAGFDVAPTIPLAIADDWTAAADLTRPYAALYLGGMGSKDKNFYQENAARMGFGEQARAVQELYLAKRYEEAQAAVPLELLDQTALLGPVERVAERMAEFAAAGVTTAILGVAPGLDGIAALRAAAKAYEQSGIAE